MRNSPFHDGEIAVQERTGERDTALRHGAGIGSRIVPGALPFLAQQRVIAVSIAGDDRNLWTSVWTGTPGFVHSEDGQRVEISTTMAATSQEDPARRRALAGREIGMLAIDFESRRRLRINGTIESASNDIVVLVRESVGNCPKYIQRRQPHDIPATISSPSYAERGHSLNGDARELVERADTAFVGSLHPQRGVDTSHRGGSPGFIEIVDASTLRIPDYRGNSLFMTLGNFAIDPRASLALVDFERGRLLCLSGSAQLEFDADDPRQLTGGTQRFWRFAIDEWVHFDLPRDVSWELLEASPFNPAQLSKR
jgi:predicted pyridoxine 5'-phosphate oxidase superfamily flavin-nucleotide-binding protein